jgi:copper chaperone CopZ
MSVPKSRYTSFEKINIILILLFAAYSVMASAEITNNETIKIKCPDMHCAGCKHKITEAVNSLEGIIELQVDLETKIITVTYNNNKISKEKILEKLAEEGYPGEIIP